jgi:4-amino-4-deoxy-L-arabinose transferase-like glycosyltransferase
MLTHLKRSQYLILVIVLACLLRILNFSFPIFTSDEARIAYRGFALSKIGEDELGRRWPLVFNSELDYQLPVTSYVTALGIFLFGKNDFGARILFTGFGLGIVFLIYKISQKFSQNRSFHFFSALVLGFSPSLILLSKIPNDVIILTFLITLLFYLIIEKTNLLLISIVLCISILVTKSAWFIIIPFLVFTAIFYGKKLSKKVKITVFLFSVILIITTVVIYLQIPQSTRSLKENNFSILSSTSIKNGIDKSRGQGINSGWPNFLEIAFFNKTFFPVIGLMNWFSSLQPSIFFGQFDKNGIIGFSQMGALNKVLIFPFLWGIVYLIREGSKKERLLVVYFLILTFPVIFNYPNLDLGLIVTTLPFAALIISFGYIKFNKILSLVIVIGMVLELGFNLLYLNPEKNNSYILRPYWIKEMILDIYSQSKNYRIGVSDDVVNDIISHIEWYTPADVSIGHPNVPFPYKFRQSSFRNIKIIGSDNQLYSCREAEYDKEFISNRDKDEFKDSDIVITKIYRDSLNKKVAYFSERGLCVK